MCPAQAKLEQWKLTLFYKFFSTFLGIIQKIIIFLVSAHSETVEKVEKICIKLNLNQKNSNFRMDSIFGWNSKNFRALGTFLGFHTKTGGVTHKVS